VAGDRSATGFAHHHTDEELLAYRTLSTEQKLRWLHDAWRFTADFLPPERRDDWQRIRAGEV
jgi:hypothetical protein